jgi:hypothetical protein
LKEAYLELPDISLGTTVGQIGHHVRYDLVSCVFRHVKGLGDGSDRVSTIGISGDVLLCQLPMIVIPESPSSPRTRSAHRSLNECIRIAAFGYHGQLRLVHGS